MISKLERVNQFKRELRSYEYYSKCVEECDLKLEEVGVQLMGISSPSLTEMSGKPTAYSDTHKLELIMLEEEIIKKRNWYIRLQADINEKLSKLNEEDRELVEKVYIKNKRYEDLAREYHYSIRNLKYKVNQILSDIL